MNELQGYDPIDEDLMRFLQELAIKHFDGHLTIMRFTTNWRTSFLTPEGRGDIEAMAVGATFRKAAIQAIDSIGSVVEMGGKRIGYLLPEPDWRQAPGWAQWWAMDKDSRAWWYAHRPAPILKEWVHSAGGVAKCYTAWDGAPRRSAAEWHVLLSEQWQESLRQRPNDA